MQKSHLRYSAGVLLVVAFCVTASGCSVDDDAPMGPASGSVAVNFDHAVGIIPLQLGVFDYTNAAGNNYSVEHLEYFVSDIRLHNANGTTFGVDDVHYRSADDNTTRGYTVPGVPNGTYTAVTFVFGLNANWNVSNGLPASTPAGGLEWPACWGGGYHYMELEGKYKESGSGTEYPYRTHTGRRKLIQGGPLNCDTAALGGPDAVSHHHFFEVKLTLPSAFAVDGDNWSVNVVMDINGWYEDPQVDLEVLFPQGNGGIMTDLNTQQLLKENGPGCFSIQAPVRQ